MLPPLLGHTGQKVIATLSGAGDGQIQNFDCRTLIIYIDGQNTPGYKLIYTMIKQ